MYIFITGLILLAAVHGIGICQAAEEGRPKTGQESPFRVPAKDWSAQIAINHIPAAGIKTMPEEAATTDYRIKLVRNIPLNDTWTLFAGGGYGLRQIDSPHAAALPGNLHALSLETGAIYRINQQSVINVRLYPGLYSDFKDTGISDLRLPVLALGTYNFDQGISVVGGFLYRFGYHSGNFIPALGFSYQPNREWRFDAIAPRPGITYIPSRQLQLYVAGDFSSEEYELHDSSAGATAMKYSDYKALAGCNYLPAPDVSVSISAGYAFERRLTFYESTRSNLMLDNAPFFRVTLNYGW